MNIKRFASTVTALLISTTLSLRAVTVQFLTVNPNEIVNITVPGYSGGAYAGIYKLSVNGVPTDSFCIDVFRDSSSSPLSNYSYNTLAASPLSPAGPMGVTAADNIEKLWAAYYSPSMSATLAAGLQVAIWETVAAGAGTMFIINGNDYGASALLASLPNLTAKADLVGLVSPSGQNYVVPGTPDGGATVGLLGLGLLALSGLRHRFSRN